MYLCMYLYMYVRIYICMYVCMYVYICMCVYIYVYMCICMHMYVCIYVYIHIYIYIFFPLLFNYISENVYYILISLLKYACTYIWDRALSNAFIWSILLLIITYTTAYYYSFVEYFQNLVSACACVYVCKFHIHENILLYFTSSDILFSFTIRFYNNTRIFECELLPLLITSLTSFSFHTSTYSSYCISFFILLHFLLYFYYSFLAISLLL